MSKRLIRIFAPQLPERLSGLLTHEINVVLYSGKTYFGYLESYAEQTLLLRDLRGHKHSIRLSEVEEVVYDRPVQLLPEK